jgi:hypothetical protein
MSSANSETPELRRVRSSPPTFGDPVMGGHPKIKIELTLPFHRSDLREADLR